MEHWLPLLTPYTMNTISLEPIVILYLSSMCAIDSLVPDYYEVLPYLPGHLFCSLFIRSRLMKPRTRSRLRLSAGLSLSLILT
jgi:hypothetical protein